jgi:MerR family transcriptional regulator/heat shock protein HspR
MDRDSEPYFVISVVSKMLKVHPQTIRHYERLGFLSPHRTGGNMRLFSKRDVERLEQICSFTNLGVNLAGVEVIVKLLQKMEHQRAELINEMEQLRKEMDDIRCKPSDQDSREEL